MDLTVIKSRLDSELAKADGINYDLVEELISNLKQGKPDITQTGITLPTNFDPGIDPSGPPYLVTINTVPDRIIRVLKHMGWDARFNELKDRPEWRHETLQPGWGSPSDEVLDALQARIMNDYEILQGRATVPVTAGSHWKSILAMFSTDTTVNEPKEWLASIEPVDGGDALLDAVVDGLNLETNSGDEAYSRWVIELMFGSVISRILEPGCHLRVVPIIYGAQDIGKGLWISKMLPDELSEYFVTGFRFQKHTKDMVDQMMGAVLLELSELHGKSSTEVEAIKSYIGPGSDTVRLSYGRRARTVKKTGSIIATANPGNDLPKDESGNTRWVPVEMTSDVTEWINNFWPELREDVFAHVLHLYEQGKRWTDIPKELRVSQGHDIAEHTYIDPVIEAKIETWQHTERSKPSWLPSEIVTPAFLMTDVLGLEPQHPRSSINRDLSIVMQAKGFVRARGTIDGVKQRGWRFAPETE